MKRFNIRTFVVFCGLMLQTMTLVYGQDTLNEKSSQNQVLTCSEVKSRIGSMLEMHYTFLDFKEELSQRTLHRYFENLDPSKIFFNLSDIRKFKDLRKNMYKKIDQNDCRFIFDIYDLYKQRVSQRVEKAHFFLSRPLPLSPTKFIEMGKQNWLLSTQDIESRLLRKIIYQYLTIKNEKNNIEDVQHQIDNSYTKLEKKHQETSRDKIYSIFLNSFAQSLDPHSAHMLPSEQDAFSAHISNKLEGIGAQLLEENGSIIIKSLIPGGVAQKDGRLKVGDVLLGVDNGNGFQDVSMLGVEDVIELIRGKKGTVVKLFALKKNGNETSKEEIPLTREEISLTEDNVQSAVVGVKNEKVGIIKISNFYTDLKCKNRLFSSCKGVAFDTEQELKKLMESGVGGILIDLRNNGGGDFPESIKLASLFIPQGVIVQTMDRNKFVTKQSNIDSFFIYKGPLVVLVNRFSASASEIFAGAIQDYRRGIIIGDDHTYGKATVQIVQEIPGTNGRRSDGAIKVTQNKFYRPSGLSNQKIGVISDIKVPSLHQAYNIGEEYLEYALPRDTISPAKGFAPLQNNRSFIEKLSELSIQRLNQNPKYNELMSRIERVRLEKNKPLPLIPKYMKYIEDRQNAEDQIDKETETADAKENQPAFSIVKKDDLQMQEAIAITFDSINLSKANPLWVGAKD